MTYFARSAVSASASPQTYFDHITNVVKHAREAAEQALRYARNVDVSTFINIVCNAAVFHDLGKLDDGNQTVLSGSNSRKALPVPHQDAGVAYLMELNECLSAMLVYAHHIGLPDLISREVQLSESLRKIPPMRIEDSLTRSQVDRTLTELLRRHEQSNAPVFSQGKPPTQQLLATDLRILFSCLTNADHSDAALASGEITKTVQYPELRAEERLQALSQYVAEKAAENNSDISTEQKRNQIRDDFFNACIKSVTDQPLTFCDAPVGTGKTTSVMAHLLRIAQKNNLRRIFVILPFTNIIRQSADIYRKALVLPGEDPDDVIAEIHHRADYKDMESRELTALWNAPIVVTTAVAFFETLASNWPASIRRLYNLPGSAVFLDEAHAMLPVKLLPLAWHWIKHTAQKWSCYWTLASGSLNHFWDLDEFKEEKDIASLSEPVNIISSDQQKILSNAEIARVTYRYKPESLNLENLVDWLAELPRPVLVVLNTVHTVAAAARLAAGKFGEGYVEHLSTALSPHDRDITLARIQKRLENASDSNWFLFSTSCVEAGVDISFRTGVRECASLSSLLQLAGRVNRSAKYEDAVVWTVNLSDIDDNVVRNPTWDTSARILRNFFEGNRDISPSLCTEAMTRELREGSSPDQLKELVAAEGTCAFRNVAKEFKVIDDNTCPVVVDENLIARIKNFDSVTWRDIQHGSVQIIKHLRDKIGVQEASRYPGLFLWNKEYTLFLGYMEGVLKRNDIDKAGYAIT